MVGQTLSVRRCATDAKVRAVYAAILRIGFPVGMRDEVVRFLRTEMLPVIQDNAGFC